jgi:hypothetical protein
MKYQSKFKPIKKSTEFIFFTRQDFLKIGFSFNKKNDKCERVQNSIFELSVGDFPFIKTNPFGIYSLPENYENLFSFKEYYGESFNSFFMKDRIVAPKHLTERLFDEIFHLRSQDHEAVLIMDPKKSNYKIFTAALILVLFSALFFEKTTRIHGNGPNLLLDNGSIGLEQKGIHNSGFFFWK